MLLVRDSILTATPRGTDRWCRRRENTRNIYLNHIFCHTAFLCAVRLELDCLDEILSSKLRFITDLNFISIPQTLPC